MLLVLGGRLAQARAEVDEAARDAARAASLARSPMAAQSHGQAAAIATLSARGISCRQLGVVVDVAGFVAGGTVSATVTCTADLADLVGLGIPTSRTVTAHFTEPVDLYRGVTTG
jgi:hypothetical protein